MENIKYEILRKNIPQVKLVSITNNNWYDYNDNLSPWTSGSFYWGPQNFDIVYNTNEKFTLGYYIWKENYWELISMGEAYGSYNIPICLNSTVDEMGVMVGFDGNIEQIEQLVNFHYIQTDKQIKVYSTTNSENLRKIVEQTYTLDFGDGNTSGLTINNSSKNIDLPYITHYYLNYGEYELTLTLNSPWNNEKIIKRIKVPSDNTVSNPLGTYTGITVPTDSGYLNYINDLDNTNITGQTTSGFTYMALGKSRISEKKLYGPNSYSGVTSGSDAVGSYSAYTIDNLYYKDYSDGYTMITGTTIGYTKEEVFYQSLTRNEHFLGFIDEPTIYSDIFVDRGNLNVTEKNFRLSESDSVGELEVYEHGYFKLKNQ